ncbi:TPM domain-containing protein [Luteibacter anthropi]|uniref:TPM domain-containing protein n=1 Tax=Luteibacter anthropi TaxID=564369 RepID=UPI0020323EBE|nr:TPM domain-containing protein [Luteibacter anthropi]
MSMRRITQNLFGEWFRMGRAFPADVLDTITKTVSEGEATHRGELRVAIESRLPIVAVAQGMTPRDRAAMLFSHLRVWDTEENCGVLLYVLLAEHRIEIVADRGIASRVSTAEWETITAHMRDEFAGERFREGVLTGVAEAGALLATHYPGDGATRENQLPDRPLIL